MGFDPTSQKPLGPEEARKSSNCQPGNVSIKYSEIVLVPSLVSSFFKLEFVVELGFKVSVGTESGLGSAIESQPLNPATLIPARRNLL